jgi:hypothetical protein
MPNLLTEFCFPCKVRALGGEIVLGFAYEVKKRHVWGLHPPVCALVSASKLCVGFLQYPGGGFFTKGYEGCVVLIKIGSVTEFSPACINFCSYIPYIYQTCVKFSVQTFPLILSVNCEFRQKQHI